MALIEIPVPRNMLSTAELSFAAAEAAALPEAPVPEVEQPGLAVDTAYAADIASGIRRYLPEHNPSRGLLAYAETTIDNVTGNPTDLLARQAAEELLHFAVRKPLADLLGPPRLAPKDFRAAEATFVACVRRGDAAAIKLVGGMLGAPAVEALCAEFGLDLQ
ncbi:MAG TPA: hypothetical protein VF466_05615 [Candidatus Saccharimonadales bacterium]